MIEKNFIELAIIVVVVYGLAFFITLILKRLSRAASKRKSKKETLMLRQLYLQDLGDALRDKEDLKVARYSRLIDELDNNKRL